MTRVLHIRNITLEGPDCCGKSTLYSGIHRATGFRWNIQDRSQLSMICYARQFGRPPEAVTAWRRELNDFLLDLNNRLVVLLPGHQVTAQRLRERGDEYQDVESLGVLHGLFEEEVDRLGPRPNVLVVREPLERSALAERVVSWLRESELTSASEVARTVRDVAASCPGQEAAGCRFRLTLEPSSPDLHSPEAMLHPPEEAYYTRILSAVLQNIGDELAGRNEYCRREAPGATRRFIFTQDTCISLLHTLLRDGHLRMRVYCRSSNAQDVLEHDLRFICHLFGRVRAHLLAQGCEPSTLSIDVELGSAHIPLQAA